MAGKQRGLTCLVFLAAAAAVAVAVAAAASGSFVDDQPADADMRFKNRNLLQEMDGEGEEGEEDDDTPKTIPEILLGPETFYERGKFFLRVRGGIVVHVLDGRNNSEKIDRIVLDAPAKGLKGSSIDGSNYMESIDWKTNFRGRQAGTELRGIVIKITVGKKQGEWEMTGLAVSGADIGGQYLKPMELKLRSSGGYSVSAPMGLCYDCDGGGLFMPDPSANEEQRYSVALSFPGMRLQVFEGLEDGPDSVGPLWTCGSWMSIGVWVGLVISVFLALITCWGFTMLANINTMDRFDDPKSKPINVPTSD